MKKNIHPKYQQVLFVDSSTGHKFVTGSTIQSKETEKFEGVEYPVYRLSISSASHPFFTGSQQLLDSEGRVDKFRKRYGNTHKGSTVLREKGEGEQGQQEEKQEEKGGKKGK